MLDFAMKNQDLDNTNTLALKVTDLHKQFGTESVLKGVHLEAAVGDVISMLGSSGSGKSTFLRCINLLEIPDAGTVTIHGETIGMTRDKSNNPIPEDLSLIHI